MSKKFLAAFPMSPLQLRELVVESIHDHFAHVRAVSSAQFAARYYSPASEPLQVEKVLARLGMIGRYMPIGCGRILDVGVGTGSLPVVLERLGFEVHGLDDDGGGQRKASTLALRFPTLRMKVCALERDVYPYEDDFFDAVTSFDVIEHLPGSPRHYLMEIYRVLKPSGVFFLSTPNVASLANRALLLMGRSIYHPLNDWFDPPGDEDSSEFSGHWREYSLSELVYMVQAVGFQILEKGCRSKPSTSRVRSANALEKILYGIADVLTSTIFRGMLDEVYVICRKPKA